MVPIFSERPIASSSLTSFSESHSVENGSIPFSRSFAACANRAFILVFMPSPAAQAPDAQDPIIQERLVSLVRDRPWLQGLDLPDDLGCLLLHPVLRPFAPTDGHQILELFAFLPDDGLATLGDPEGVEDDSVHMIAPLLAVDAPLGMEAAASCELLHLLAGVAQVRLDGFLTEELSSIFDE